ncbi:MAG TPA: YbaK/EbsC family protein [Bryobacteraceae bacterium]|nr:YbaK/EbsC family protein [Bryobacteraceae bacterium]
MAVLEKLRGFLDENRAEYTHTIHSPAFTAREVASAEHMPARTVAKTVVLFGDGGYHMVVVPANKLVDFQEARFELGLNQARLATEEELAKLFPDCELGAMPPIGPLYQLPVYLDSGLAEEDIITFNGGTHRDVVHMRTEDFLRLVSPTVVSLARASVYKAGW